MFLLGYRFSETERKDPNEALEFSCILKENSSHGSVVASFHCLTLSLPMNKVSLKGVRAPSPPEMSFLKLIYYTDSLYNAAVSHWII